MTKLEQARKLIADAQQDPYECTSALIVAAVREYAVLLDVVEAAKGIHIKNDRDGKPVIIGMLALSEAVRKWDES